METVLRNKRQPVQYNREESFYFKKNAFLFFLLGDVSSNGPEHISRSTEKKFSGSEIRVTVIVNYLY